MSDAGPVFIIGLPRSGSTLLSRILNESAQIVSLNDLYYLQAVIAENSLEGLLNETQLTKLLNIILKVVETRGTENHQFIGQFSLASDQINQIRAQILSSSKNRMVTWSSLMDETLSKIANVLGKKRWADKTPQNFMHVELLQKTFPNAKFIFLIRDPRKILLSYKYATSEGHDKRRYHPIPYAFYWKSAVERFRELEDKLGDRILLVRYEDILNDVSDITKTLSRFLHTDINTLDILSIGSNTSFKKGEKRALLDTEVWLCEYLCSRQMKYLGYQTENLKPRVSDFFDIFGLSLRFLLFQAVRFVSDRDSRMRIIAVFKQIVKT